MSKILRRPMFRGGPVDSRGTGITSGLMDGGRVGYNRGNLVAPLYTATSPTIVGKDIMDLAKTKFSAGMPFPYKVGPIKGEENEEIEEVGKVKETFEPLGSDILDSDFDTTETIDGKIVTKPYKGYVGNEPGIDRTTKEFIKGLGEPGMSEGYKQAVEDAKKISETSSEGYLPMPGPEKGVINNNDTTGNEPSVTEISAQDLIRENAELFKELLGEGQKERIKKARIGDASDYLLKFFEGTQKEGATVGSAAADVAGFATSRDSRTEKARAANEKIDQTATVLAINDYIAGKRSKEDIMKALSVAKARISLSEGTLGDKILKAKGSGPVTVTVIRDVLRSEPEFSGKSVEEFDSTKADLTYSEGDENKIFIDVITKETFTFDENKNKKRIY